MLFCYSKALQPPPAPAEPPLRRLPPPLGDFSFQFVVYKTTPNGNIFCIYFIILFFFYLSSLAFCFPSPSMSSIFYFIYIVLYFSLLLLRSCPGGGGRGESIKFFGKSTSVIRIRIFQPFSCAYFPGPAPAHPSRKIPPEKLRLSPTSLA